MDNKPHRPTARILRRRQAGSSSSSTTSATSAQPPVAGGDDRKRAASGLLAPAGKRKREDEEEAFDEVSFTQSGSPPPPPSILRSIDVQSHEFVIRSAERVPDTFTLIGRAHEIGRRLFEDGGGRNEPMFIRPNPLPSIDWADRKEVWSAMQRKERLSTYKRDPALFERHPSLHERMRAILIDWLIEVCEVYKLHRESLYLGVDLADRYLTRQADIPKSQLQLVGVTALFVASKIEEIYPPKLAEFCFVTDGACTEEEILEQEVIMLQVLHWNLSPLTTITWLQMYLQTIGVQESYENNEQEQSFLVPQYDKQLFVRIARLLDLCILDAGCLRYEYSILATSALCLLSSQQHALYASGYTVEDITPCVHWMKSFVVTLHEDDSSDDNRQFSLVATDEQHTIQTHCVSITLLDAAQARSAIQLPPSSTVTVVTSPDSPLTVAPPVDLMTPPKSTRSKLTRQSLASPPGCVAVGSPVVDCTRLSLRDRRTPEKSSVVGAPKTRAGVKDYECTAVDYDKQEEVPRRGGRCNSSSSKDSSYDSSTR